MSELQPLTVAVDRLTASVRALYATLPPSSDPVAQGNALRELDAALGDLLAVALGAASAQSAGATVAVIERVHAELAAIRERLEAGGL